MKKITIYFIISMYFFFGVIPYGYGEESSMHMQDSSATETHLPVLSLTSMQKPLFSQPISSSLDPDIVSTQSSYQDKQFTWECYANWVAPLGDMLRTFVCIWPAVPFLIGGGLLVLAGSLCEALDMPIIKEIWGITLIQTALSYATGEFIKCKITFFTPSSEKPLFSLKEESQGSVVPVSPAMQDDRHATSPLKHEEEKITTGSFQKKVVNLLQTIPILASHQISIQDVSQKDTKAPMATRDQSKKAVVIPPPISVPLDKKEAAAPSLQEQKESSLPLPHIESPSLKTQDEYSVAASSMEKESVLPTVKKEVGQEERGEKKDRPLIVPKAKPRPFEQPKTIQEPENPQYLDWQFQTTGLCDMLISSKIEKATFSQFLRAKYRTVFSPEEPLKSGTLTKYVQSFYRTYQDFEDCGLESDCRIERGALFVSLEYNLWGHVEEPYKKQMLLSIVKDHKNDRMRFYAARTMITHCFSTLTQYERETVEHFFYDLLRNKDFLPWAESIIEQLMYLGKSQEYLENLAQSSIFPFCTSSVKERVSSLLAQYSERVRSMRQRASAKEDTVSVDKLTSLYLTRLQSNVDSLSRTGSLQRNDVVDQILILLLLDVDHSLVIPHLIAIVKNSKDPYLLTGVAEILAYMPEDAIPYLETLQCILPSLPSDDKYVPTKHLEQTISAIEEAKAIAELELEKKQLDDIRIEVRDEEIMVYYLLKDPQDPHFQMTVSLPFKVLVLPRELWGDPHISSDKKTIAFVGADSVNMLTYLSLKGEKAAGNITPCPFLWIPADARPDDTLVSLTMKFAQGQSSYDQIKDATERYFARQATGAFFNKQFFFQKCYQYFLKVFSVCIPPTSNSQGFSYAPLEDIRVICTKDASGEYIIANAVSSGHKVAIAMKIKDNSLDSVSFGIRGPAVNMETQCTIPQELLNSIAYFIEVPVELVFVTAGNRKARILLNQDSSGHAIEPSSGWRDRLIKAFGLTKREKTIAKRFEALTQQASHYVSTDQAASLGKILEKIRTLLIRKEVLDGKKISQTIGDFFIEKEQTSFAALLNTYQEEDLFIQTPGPAFLALVEKLQNTHTRYEGVQELIAQYERECVRGTEKTQEQRLLEALLLNPLEGKEISCLVAETLRAHQVDVGPILYKRFERAWQSEYSFDTILDAIVLLDRFVSNPSLVPDVLADIIKKYPY